MLLKTQWFAEEIKEEIKNPRDKENGSMMTQNLWDAAKAILRGKFIQILATKLGKKKKTQLNNPILHLKQLEKEGQHTQS